MGRRKTGRKRDSSGVLALIALFLVTLTTLIQNIIDWLQSMSMGAYQPMWQRILILTVLTLSFLGFMIAYMANSKSRKSPIP